MLQTIAIILIILWVLGLVSSYTMGGLIHILLVIAIVGDSGTCHTRSASVTTLNNVYSAGCGRVCARLTRAV